MAKGNSIALQVNGKEYNQFKKIKVTRSLDAVSGSFSFQAANKRISDFPFKIFDAANVVVNGIQSVNGYIYKMNPAYSDKSHTVEITGFDKTRDLVDIKIFRNVQYNTPITLQRLALEVTTDGDIFGMNVRDQADAPPFKEGELLAGETGETLFSYLERHARKRNVILSNDGDGNLVLYRNSGNAIGATLTNIFNEPQNSNIISASANYDYTNRFDRMIVVSQQDGEDNVRGFARDDEIKRVRGVRTHVVVSETVQDVKACTELAEWEVNKRRSDSITYNCEVQGFWATDTMVWQPNQLVDIVDEYADINSRMLLRSVDYSFDETSGSRASLSFVSPDSYSLQANDPKAKNKVGDDIG